MSIEKISSASKKYKKEGKTVALITGCFDILHIGHIKLFEYAKSKADILIVGLENDTNINMAKGPERPIFNYIHRRNFLRRIQLIDHIFLIKNVTKFDSPNANEVYSKIYQKIKPDYVITNPISDRYWKDKEENCKKVGIKLSLYSAKVDSSTTKILKILEKEL